MRVEFIYPKENKIVRSEILLSRYKRDMIRHTKPLTGLIGEALQFPNFLHSPNQLDSVSQAVEYLAKMGTTPKALTVGVRRR
jgi:hypothetical protein